MQLTQSSDLLWVVLSRNPLLSWIVTAIEKQNLDDQIPVGEHDPKTILLIGSYFALPISSRLFFHPLNAKKYVNWPLQRFRHHILQFHFLVGRVVSLNRVHVAARRTPSRSRSSSTSTSITRPRGGMVSLRSGGQSSHIVATFHVDGGQFHVGGCHFRVVLLLAYFDGLCVFCNYFSHKNLLHRSRRLLCSRAPANKQNLSSAQESIIYPFS